MQLDHPSDWELARVSSPGEPGHLTFSDRRFQRMEVRWLALNFAPELDLLLEKYRKADNKEGRTVPLEGQPSPWQGLTRQMPNGSVVRAARTFPQQRLLVETTLIWPDGRDVELERAILASVAAMPAGPAQLWQALGVSATIPAEYDLRGLSASVGRVRWEFAPAGKSPPRIAIERLAMPEFWLKDPLRDWLARELPSQHYLLRQDTCEWNKHRGERLISHAFAGTLAALRGRRRMRLDLAWQCPVENRVYHVEFAELSADSEIVLPKTLAVRCCRRTSVAASVSPQAR
jgi:hypothetical protein